MQDTCAGTLSTTMACSLRPEHHRTVACRKYFACFYDALPLLVEVYAKQVLRPDSDINRSKIAAEARTVPLKEMTALVSKKSVSKWNVPSKLVHVYIFPGYTRHFLENLYKDGTWLEKCRDISLSQSSEK